MVSDGAYSHMLNFFWTFSISKGIPIALLAQELHPFLLNGWNLPIGGASVVEGQRSTGLPRLVLINIIIITLNKFVSISAITDKPENHENFRI